MPARDERAPLLRETFPPSTSSKPVQTWREVCELMRSMTPISLSFALQNVVQAWNILFAGTLGSFELEVASYGFIFASCTGAMVAFGGATALDTLCGQAMTSVMNSDTDRKRLDLYLQQTLLVLLGLFLIFIAPLWVFSGQLFQVLGLQRELSATTGTFLQSLLASGLLQVVSECLKKFLQVQGGSSVVGWITAVAACLGALVSYVTVKFSNLGLWGCAVAFTIYQFLNVVGFVFIMIHRPSVRESMRFSAFGLSKGLFYVTAYAITGTLTVAVEWWR
jgi:multidrug resistance protein, MATE family